MPRKPRRAVVSTPYSSSDEILQRYHLTKRGLARIQCKVLCCDSNRQVVEKLKRLPRKTLLKLARDPQVLRVLYASLLDAIGNTTPDVLDLFVRTYRNLG